MSSFKTYVDITEYGTEDYEFVINEDIESKLEPRLLPGEVVVASAPNILKFASSSNLKHGTSGSLFVTNYKISFVTTSVSPLQTSGQEDRKKLLGPLDVCLVNVDQVFCVSSGDRRKKILPGASVTSPTKILQLVCKDFSVHSFGFKFCPVGASKAIVNAILHHAFPKRLELLFAFECRLPATKPVRDVRPFTTSEDWEGELIRCHSIDNWRVTKANENYQLSASLPEAFVVPRSLSDAQILKASKHFMANRPPFWSWGHSNSCVIVRMASLYQFITDSQQESIMLEHVRKSHSSLREPLILELDKSLPPLSDMQSSWQKLRDFCCSPVDSIRKLWELDGKFYSLLGSSNWPALVCRCLNIALRVVNAILEHQVSVVLQEGESRDTSAVISSLAQIIIDPHFRSITGFQNLVQKEWVALGHPFSKRLGRTANNEAEQAPLFQLFLDCVWQLQQQFPASFEFTDTYLTSLLDSLHNPVFDTFLFDSERARQVAFKDEVTPLTQRSVWDWEYQLQSVEIGLFYNPLYSITRRVVHARIQRNLPKYDEPQSVVFPPVKNRTSSMGTLERNRRSSIASMTLSRREFPQFGEYGGHDSDTLGRSWGSRIGLAGLMGTDTLRSTGKESISKWGRFRGALFQGHGGSFSPRNKERRTIASIEEGFESSEAKEAPLVTYRSNRSLGERDIQQQQQQQRWTVCADRGEEPPPRAKLSAKQGSLNLELTFDGDGVPWQSLAWPVYSVLPVAAHITAFRIWSQCYLRFIPALDIRGGGQPSVYFELCNLVNDILKLENQLDGNEVDLSSDERYVTMNHKGLSSFHPFGTLQNDTVLAFGEWEIVPSPVSLQGSPPPTEENGANSND